MAETIGWLTDKIIVTELKIYHVLEEIQRHDVDEFHKKMCQERLKILKLQRDDLSDELSSLYKDVIHSKARPKIYRQFKMYNDPRFLLKK